MTSEEEDVNIQLFRNNSIDDLRFELKRLQQKYDVLERDKKILEDEGAIASKSINDSGTVDKLSKELATKNREVLKWFELTSTMGQKHRVVLRHLWLEKRALKEMKAELSKGMHAMFSSQETLDALQHIAVGVQGLDAEKRSLLIALKQSKGTRLRLVHSISEFRERLRTERKAFHEMKRSVNENINEWSEYFCDTKRLFIESIAKSVKMHNHAVYRAQSIQGQYEELSVKYAKSQIDSASSAEAINVLRNELSILKQRKEAEMYIINIKNKELSDSLEERDRKVTMLNDNNNVLSEKLETSMNQLRRLADIQESVQKDFEAALAREEQLKSELSINGSSKSEISARLKRIQEKVNRMEDDHSQQLRKMELELQKVKDSHDIAMNEKDAKLNEAENNARVMESNYVYELDRWKAQYNALQEQEDQKIVSDRNSKLKIAEQEGIVSSLRAELAELKLKEKDAIDIISSNAAELKRLDTKLKESESIRSNLTLDMQRLEGQLVQYSKSDEKDKQISENKAEIARLLTVIQKECQERTELIIQISELKDYIRDNSIMNGGSGGNNSALKSSTAYSQLSSVGGLSQEKIQSSLVSNYSEAATSSSDRRLAEAISYSRAVDSTQEGGPASSGIEDDGVWSQRIHQGGGRGGRGRKASRGGHYK